MGEKVKKKGSKIDGSDSGSSFELESNKGQKKKHKESKKRHGTDEILNLSEALEENCTGEAAERQTCYIEEDIAFTRNKEDESHINKREKKKGRKDIEVINDNVSDGKEMQFLDGNKQRKMKKRKDCNDSLAGMQEMGASKPSKKGRMTRDNEFKSNEGDHSFVTEKDKGKEMKIEKLPSKKSTKTEVDDQGKKMKVKKKIKASKSESPNPASGGTSKSKRVTFCDQVEVFGDGLMRGKRFTPGDQHLAKINEGEDDDQDKKMMKKKKKKKLSEKSKLEKNIEFNGGDQHLAKSSEGEDDDQGKKMKKKKISGKRKSKEISDFKSNEGDLVLGKRFTKEEDGKIKEALSSYIESHGLGDEGLDMIMHCRSHPEVRGCWKEISAALPHRPLESVYSRAHTLFEYERDGIHKWTPEELEFIRNVREQHGSDWRSVAEVLRKSRIHVKDAWRRVKLASAKTGRLSQEEYQKLFDLVNLDLQVRALEESRQSKHGMLRDNISWEAIATKLETRTSQRCCKLWYEQLTSPMVADGIWSDTDDYRLINALFNMDACCFDEVEWDDLLEHRSGDVCRKRWNQMVRYIGENVGKSFAEQVEILAKRFCPYLIEAREAFDSKPVVG